MSAEPEFPLACVRRFLHPHGTLPDSARLDWDALARLAAKHAVVPLLYLAAREAAAPPAVLDVLRGRFEEGARLNLTLAAELARLLALFERENIGAVPLKGPVLAAALYGNLALRASSDLDLLIRPRDLIRVRHLLPSLGFRLSSTLHWPCESACFRPRERQLSFADQAGVISVDVHWHPLPGYFPDNCDTGQLWRGVRAVPLAGVTASALSPEQSDPFPPRPWRQAHLGAPGLGLRCCPPASDRASNRLALRFAQARQTGTSRILALGLLVARDPLGVDLPPPAAGFAARDPHARALAQTVRERFFANAPTPTPAVEATLFIMRRLRARWAPSALRFRHLHRPLRGRIPRHPLAPRPLPPLLPLPPIAPPGQAYGPQEDLEPTLFS